MRSTSTVGRALRITAGVGLVVYCAALFVVTLTPGLPLIGDQANYVPFSSILGYATNSPSLYVALRQIGGNALLMLPLGLLLPIALPPRARRFGVVVLIALSLALTIEGLQGVVIEGRTFDIDDVILNCIGSVLGFGVFLIVRPNVEAADHSE